MDNRRLTISRNEHFFSPRVLKDLCSVFSVSYHTLLNGGRSSERACRSVDSSAFGCSRLGLPASGIPSLEFFSFQIEHGHGHTQFTASLRHLRHLGFEERTDLLFVLWIYHLSPVI